MPHALYICHSSKDRTIADAVCSRLEAAGLECWVAPRNVSPGSDWAESILGAISRSRAMVLIYSSNANESAHVKREIHRAIQIGLPVVPFRTDNSAPSETFTYFGSAFRWIDATSRPLENHIPQLVEAVKEIISGKPDATVTSQGSLDGEPKERYDAFISYRREGGSSDARNICMGLMLKNVRSFLDVDDLRSGHFDEALLRRIEETPNFIVILSPHSLDRCADERDWLRREIAHAIRTNRNIIPVTVKGFDFPRVESLPEDISSLETHNAVDYSHDYFGPMIDKIIGFLRTAAPATKATPQTKSKSESSGAGPGLTFGRLVAAPDSLIGQRIGKYAVKEFIGAGGSGLVYRALRTALGREVCIKIFYPLIAEAGEAAYIIQRGARALASMNHPHIIKVLDLETLDFDDASSFCLITEFVRGRELRDWSLKIAEADTTPYTRLLSMRLQMATAITTALAAAHCCRYTDERGVEQTGILHGDIKPSNIIVRDDNSPVVLDFMMLDIQRLIDRGFAPLNRPERHEPITAAYGTPGFMPPEQDRDGILTVKSDIFSLGVTLAHLFVPDSDNPLVDLFAAEQDELLDGLRLLVRDMVSEDPMSRPRDMDEVARRLAVCGEKLESDPPAASLVSKAEQVLEAEALAASNATAAGASQSLSAASITPSPAATIAIPAEDDKRRAKRAKMGGLVGALLWGGLAAVTGVAQLNTGYGAGGIKSPFDLIVFIAIGIVLGAGVGFLITASRKGRIFGIAGVLAGVVVNMFLWKEREAFVLVTALLGLFGSLGGALAEGSGKKNTAKR